VKLSVVVIFYIVLKVLRRCKRPVSRGLSREKPPFWEEKPPFWEGKPLFWETKATFLGK